MNKIKDKIEWLFWDLENNVNKELNKPNSFDWKHDKVLFKTRKNNAFNGYKVNIKIEITKEIKDE